MHMPLDWRVAQEPPDLVSSPLVVFTDYGTIKKVRAPLKQSSGSCLLEEIELFPERRQEHIRSLQILHSQSVLFVGLREHVAKVPLKRCQFYRTRRYGMPGRSPLGRQHGSPDPAGQISTQADGLGWEQSCHICRGSILPPTSSCQGEMHYSLFCN